MKTISIIVAEALAVPSGISRFLKDDAESARTGWFS